MKLARAKDLKFELSGGRTFIVPAPTIRQITDCIELDPAPETVESPADKLERIVAQAKILLSPKGEPAPVDADDLTFDELLQVTQAIFAHVHGQDPVDALALQNWLRDQAKKKDANRSTVSSSNN